MECLKKGERGEKERGRKKDGGCGGGKDRLVGRLNRKGGGRGRGGGVGDRGGGGGRGGEKEGVGRG